MTFNPLDCASWLFNILEDGPLNILSTYKGLFTILTVQEPPFEEALDWLQFAYTVYRAGDSLAHASTVLIHSSIAEGDHVFPEILLHLRRLYPEVYGPVVSLGSSPVLREFPLGEDGEVLSNVNLSVNSFSKLGTYVGIF